MKKLLIALAVVFAYTFANADASKPQEKPPVTAQSKPVVKKPCKEGQDPDKDNCHALKKVDKKK